MLDSAVVSEMQGPGGAALNTFGFGAMVAGAGVMVDSGVGIGARFITFDTAEQNAHIEAVSIFAGYLTGAVADAFIDIKIKS